MEEQEMPSAAAAPATTADQTATASATPLETARDHEQPNPAPSIPPPSDIPEPSEKQHKDEPTQSEPSSLSDSATPITAQEAASLTSQPEPSQYPMQTPQQPTATPAKGGPESGRGSRSSKRVSFPIVGEDTPATATDATPSSAPRGRPPGRPRGSRARGPTRASTRGSRGGKRKRADDDDDDDGLSSDSEIYAPTTTKSGRNVQKPTSFVPPPQPSPPSVPTYKKKRTYRRNPESAVCKICLRGVSPASNMIVFCDGCNVPYHRYCHQPPIDQSVIDELDKEWYCKQCTRAMIQPVPEPHTTNFVSAEGASAEERQKYFSTLPPGLLVTLLTKATTLQPSLPLFDPSFRPNPNANPTNTPAKPPAANGHSHPQPIFRDMNDSDNDGEYPSDEHPAHYPRPGQGLMSTLGPEKDDLHYLVDEENSRGVFTHVYREDGEVVGAGAEAGAER